MVETASIKVHKLENQSTVEVELVEGLMIKMVSLFLLTEMI
jgi:hypothetical protein